jgi:hypothetical protein
MHQQQKKMATKNSVNSTSSAGQQRSHSKKPSTELFGALARFQPRSQAQRVTTKDCQKIDGSFTAAMGGLGA